jgi:hypothetical protein
VPSATKTDNFKVNANAVTFCLTVQKQFLQSDGNFAARPNWEFDLTDPLGTVNAYFTDGSGQLLVCGLVPGAYTVSEALAISENQGSSVIGLKVNGTTQLPPFFPVYSFTWAAGQTMPIIVFQNQIPIIVII